jgi:hypothetical protein
VLVKGRIPEIEGRLPRVWLAGTVVLILINWAYLIITD